MKWARSATADREFERFACSATPTSQALNGAAGVARSLALP